MPHINDLFPSTLLTREDFPKPVVAEILDVTEEKLETPRGPEAKWIVWFKSAKKRLVLNRTNATAIAKIVGSDRTEDWCGHHVELFNDTSVVGPHGRGGIRVRAPSQPEPRPAPRHHQVHERDFDEFEPSHNPGAA